MEYAISKKDEKIQKQVFNNPYQAVEYLKKHDIKGYTVTQLPWEYFNRRNKGYFKYVLTPNK